MPTDTPKKRKISKFICEILVDNERCKGCGFCVEYCPKDVLVLSKEFNAKGYHPPEAVKAGECVNCSLCEMICPDFAIYSVEAGREKTDDTAEATLSDGAQA